MTSNNNRVNNAQGSRIPLTLQAVFLASNRGNEVHKPPPNRVAFRVFRNNWLFRRRSGSADCTMSEECSVSKTMEKPAGVAPQVKKSKKKQRKLAPQAWKRLFSRVEASTTKSEQLTPQADIKPAPTTTIQLAPSVNEQQLGVSPGLTTSASPQAFLDELVASQGGYYNHARYPSLQTAYHNRPTKLQQSSYGIALVQACQRRQIGTFKAILKSGISPNPCNVHGESLVHMICRRGDVQLLQIMLQVYKEVMGESEESALLQISDDYGRTPLHDACWAAEPCFGVIDLLTQHDRHLWFISDSRGALPLAYTRPEHALLWIEYFQTKRSAYWPYRDLVSYSKEGPPPLTSSAPHTRCLQDPPKALSPKMAAMVSSGSVSPETASLWDVEEQKQHSSSLQGSTFNSVDSSGEIDQMSFLQLSHTEISEEEESSSSSFSDEEDDGVEGQHHLRQSGSSKTTPVKTEAAVRMLQEASALVAAAQLEEQQQVDNTPASIQISDKDEGDQGQNQLRSSCSNNTMPVKAEAAVQMLKEVSALVAAAQLEQQKQVNNTPAPIQVEAKKPDLYTMMDNVEDESGCDDSHCDNDSYSYDEDSCGDLYEDDSSVSSEECSGSYDDDGSTSYDDEDEDIAEIVRFATTHVKPAATNATA